MNIKIENLGKRYKRITALESVSLEIPAGSIVAVIGLNGAGKSTLLRAMAGMIVPSTGSITYGDKPFSREDIELRRRMLWMPDFPLIESGTNAIQYVAMMVCAYQVAVTKELESSIIDSFSQFDLLESVGVPVDTLSRGQFYKVALTAMRAVNPDLIMLDEPFASGIDPRGQAVLRDYAYTVSARGGTFIYTTQIPEIVARFADVVCVLDHGKLAALVTRSDLDAMARDGIDLLENLMEAKQAESV